MPKPFMLPGLLLLGLLVLHCGKTADEPSDAGSATDAASSTTPGNDGGATDAALDGASPPLDAAVAPKVSCTEDASVCDSIPPSVCVDGTTLVYFSAGTCTDGSCTWKQSSMPCGAQSYCVNGGCTPPTTK